MDRLSPLDTAVAAGQAPAVSIVITSFNYGHFLGSAIDSALAQTDHLVEVVVVDDGSTDNTAEVIAGYGDRVVAVSQPNRGQAAAFAAGFAKTTGGIIIFLDADDMLKPEAVGTIRAAWHPKLALVSYGLELIDGAGRRIGIYPVFPSPADQRPQLADRGFFPFMPTSGNALARATVEAALPFPEARWKISADAYLLRVAALRGRMLPLQQSLGYYRIHEANSYFKLGAPQPWLDRRGIIDLADVSLEFGSRKQLARASAGVADALRLSFLLATLRAELALADLRASRKVGRALRGLAAGFLGSRAPLVPRTTAAAVLTALSLGLWRLPAVKRWLRHPHERPTAIRGVLNAFGRHSIVRYLARAKIPRWRQPAALNESIDTIDLRRRFEVLGTGWSSTFRGAPAWTDESTVGVILRLEPCPEPLIVNVHVVVSPRWSGRAVAVDALIGGALMSTTIIVDGGAIEVMLPQGSAVRGRTVAIDLAIRPYAPRGLRQLWRDAFSEPPLLGLTSVWVGPRDSLVDPAAAPDMAARPASDFVEETPVGWLVDDGVTQLVAPTASMRFVTPPQARQALLRLGVPAGQPRGIMRIATGTLEIFSGTWGAAGEIWSQLPENASGRTAVVELSFAFLPSSGTEIDEPTISTMTFFYGPEEAAPPYRASGRNPPPANPGQRFTFADGSAGAESLVAGWAIEPEGALLTATSGEIELRLMPSVAELAATLNVEPVMPPPPNYRHVVIAIVDDEVIARAVLEGPGAFTVPLARERAERRGTVTIALRSLFVALRAEDESSTGEVDTLPAQLMLRDIVFAGAVVPAEAPPALPSPPGNALDGILAGVASEDLEDIDVAAAADARQRAVALLTHASAGALRAIVSSSRTVAALEALGRTLQGDPLTSPVATGPRGALRSVLIGMMGIPPHELPGAGDLARLPPELLWHPEVLARYLTREPPVHPDGDRTGAYRRYIDTLLAAVDTVLATDPSGSALREVATAVLSRLRPHYLLMQTGSVRQHAELKARAIERTLIAEGYTLDLAFAPRPPRAKLRVGIVMREWHPGPETWIVRAIAEGLDPSRIEVVPIVVASEGPELPLDLGPVPGDAIIIAGTTVAEAVDTIRGLQLDVVLLGAFFFNWYRLPSIVAHKLAPIQAIMAAIAPVTSGLRSFDTVISSRVLEGPMAQDDYSEELVLMDGPAQCFAIDRQAHLDDADMPAVRRSIARRRMGLPYPGTQFISGAMAHKIGPALLDAWTKILSRLPDATLILYPFAPNWKIDFASDAFESALRARLAASGIASERLIVLRDVPRAEVRRLLRVSDIYLDAFPYAGATTVVEALEEGLPVVALMGEHQRSRQGAAWLHVAGLSDDAASSQAAYVDRAVALASDPALLDERRTLVDAYRSQNPAHRDVTRYGRELSDTLIGLAARRGIALSPTLLPPPPAPAAIPDEDVRYLFHHVPKTAGTSARSVFKRWFNVIDDKRKPWATSEFPAPLDLTQMGARDLVMGHYEVPGMLLRERYPDVLRDRRWRIIAFVRDPLEIALSVYFFEKERRPRTGGFVHKDLSAYLRARTDYLAELLDVTADNWRELLDAYWFIGTVERLDESMAYLARHFGKDLPPMPVENVTARHEVPDPADIDAYMAANALDYDIYREISRRLDERLSEKT